MNSATLDLSVALIAHDGLKAAMVDWVGRHRCQLRRARLIATGTTARRIREAWPDLTVTAMASGPEGGDLQIGASIVEGAIDALIFFVDPRAAMPHDVDVKALIRIAALRDLPFALAPTTADLVLAGLASRFKGMAS